jgi:Uma2 family endonuclease
VGVPESALQDIDMATKPVVKQAPSSERYTPPPQGEWTYEDYARLPDNGFRYEVIDGDLFMAPAPGTKHQRAIMELSGRLWDFLRRSPAGEVLVSPIDVILPGYATPVQPDVVFISKEHQEIIKEEFIEGIPDLLVEVISPGNPAHDRRTKFHLYARSGVKEYWILDPALKVIDVYVLRDQAYALLGRFSSGEQAHSEVLAEFTVGVDEICPAR